MELPYRYRIGKKTSPYGYSWKKNPIQNRINMIRRKMRNVKTRWNVWEDPNNLFFLSFRESTFLITL
jgi:hypothetical protein